MTVPLMLRTPAAYMHGKTHIVPGQAVSLRQRPAFAMFICWGQHIRVPPRDTSRAVDGSPKPSSEQKMQCIENVCVNMHHCQLNEPFEQ
jgi:hypothetical protein